MSRRTLFRLAAPVALLLAATVAVLLIRSALHHDRHDAAKPGQTATPTVAPTTFASAATTAAAPARRYYRIQSGDTFSAVAVKFETTVDALQALNPGIDPYALTVGQRIRVR